MPIPLWFEPTPPQNWQAGLLCAARDQYYMAVDPVRYRAYLRTQLGSEPLWWPDIHRCPKCGGLYDAARPKEEERDGQ